MKTLIFVLLFLSINTSVFSQTATTQPDSTKTKKKAGFGGERFQKLKVNLENVGESIIKGVDKASSLINGTSSTPQPTKETSSNSQSKTSNGNQEVDKAVQHESNKATEVSPKTAKSIPVDTKESGWKDIHEYAQVGDVEKLIEIIEKGIYVDFPTQRPTKEYVQTLDDLTPLMVAVKNRKLEACKILMLYGADPSIKNADKKTALDLAKEYQFTEITKALQNREATKNTKSWQQLLKNAQQAYRNGEYVIANSLSCAALNNIKNDPTKRDSEETLSIINLLADSYEKMAVFPKAELFLNQAILINEKAFGNQSKEYATSLIRLCDFFTRIAYHDKSALLLEILNDWSQKNNIKDKLVQAKIMDSNGFHFLAQRNNEGIKWLSKALTIKKNIVGDQHYEYGISLLNVFKAQKGKMYSNLVEQSNSKGNGIRDEVTYTVNIVENIVIQIQKLEGEFSQNYLEALNFLSFVKSSELDNTTKILIQKTVENITSVNYQRGLLHFPDPELLQHNYLLQFNTNNTKSLYYLFTQKNSIEKTYGKVHPAYLNVLGGLATDYGRTGNPQWADFYNAQIQLLAGYLETHYTIPNGDVGIYNLLLPDLERYRNSQKNFIVTWANKNNLALKHLFDFLISDKQKLLSKYQKFKKEEAKAALNITAAFQENLDRINGQTAGKPKSYKEVYGMSREDHGNLLLGTQNLARTIADQGVNAMNFGIPAEFENGKKVNPKEEKHSLQDIQSKLAERQVAVEYFYLDKSKLYADSTSIDYYALIIKPGNNAPVLKRLFREDELKAQIDYSNDTLSAKVKAIYRIDPMKVNQPKNPKPIAGKLYQLCWKPIESELANTDTLIYYSPSGLLHKVSFAAITAPTTPNAAPKTLGEKYNLRYLSSIANLLNTSAILPIDATTSAVLFGNPTTDLRYASEEVGAINKTLVGRKAQSTVYDSLNATEESFKNIGIQKKSPQIVHVAAHGAYRTDSLPSKSKNPMLKSVLRMAGGKNKNLNELTDVDSNDGVLTAQEISELNFTNTQLVVLSACESGLGDAAGEEGVFGLQRAFKMAGAEYILATLWPIQDNTTSVMMGYFYNNLANKQSIPDAFNNAIKSMRKAKYQPYQWGAFVLIR